MAERYRPLILRNIGDPSNPYSRYVSEHPAIMVTSKSGGWLGGGVDCYGSPATGLSFYTERVIFIDKDRQRPLRFYFAERQKPLGEIEDIALMVGTTVNGPEVMCRFKGKREIDGNKVIYRYFPIWENLNTGNAAVLIESRKPNQTPHVLDQRGYLSPFDTVLDRHSTYGVIFRVPKT